MLKSVEPPTINMEFKPTFEVYAADIISSSTSMCRSRNGFLAKSRMLYRNFCWYSDNSPH
ncbi:hypothetical protein Ciccas_002432 [Cichlidogyrus casuarinus]|uniref:Uncharacterized protein n=1 Tax=Cichlidogyrus casuarinus TaxID=1844966 RepID=A0ABD2QJG8_9PLAT